MIPYISDLFDDVFRARLGETRDPKELIPGDPEAICSAADALAAQGRRLEEIGDELGAVRTPGWMGDAANAFWEFLSGEKTNWFKASDAMSGASRSLNGYSDALSWAQAQAQEAIFLWEKGEDLTRQATVRFEAALDAQNQAAAAANAPPVPPTPFSDPGAELREQAQAILQDARQEVSEAGTRAAEAIAGHGGKGDDSPGWLAKAAEKVAGLVDLGGGEKPSGKLTFTDEGWEHKLFDDVEDSLVDSGWLGDKQDLGPVDAGLRTRQQALGYEATGKLAHTGDGLSGELRGEAYLYKGQTEVSAEYLLADTTLASNVSVEAEAGVDGSIGMDGVDVGADAFAGAKIDGKLSSEVAGVGAGVTAEGWAGAGVEADVTAGVRDGTLVVGGEAGVGLGLGGKLGYEVTVDPGEVVDTVGDAADAVGDAANTAADTVGDAASTVGNAADTLGDGARSAFGKTVGDWW